MRNPADSLRQFESLGDNCEFGFVQRKYGLEPGGLLRWAISPIQALTTALIHRFDDFYRFEELRPSADDMVWADRYGLAFHTSLRSRMENGQRVFVANDETLRQLYDIEIIKMNYMRDKLIKALLDADRTFIFKANGGVDDDNGLKLYNAIKKFNNDNRLLIVRASNEEHPVKRAGDTLYLGNIDRFAPYTQADDASYDRWVKMCDEFLDLLEVS